MIYWLTSALTHAHIPPVIVVDLHAQAYIYFVVVNLACPIVPSANPERTFASHMPSHLHSTPVNGHRGGESVEELSTVAAVPPLDLSPSSHSTLEKSSSSKKKQKKKKKQGESMRHGKKSHNRKLPLLHPAFFNHYHRGILRTGMLLCMCPIYARIYAYTHVCL